jgi:hypothetical protein
MTVEVATTHIRTIISLNNIRHTRDAEIVKSHSMQVQINKPIVHPPLQGFFNALNGETEVLLDLTHMRATGGREVTK